MSYKLVRLLLSLIGLGSLGGFGWSFYEFLTHRDAYSHPLTRSQVDKLDASVRGPARGGNAHLKSYQPHFDNLHMLNVTGKVPPPDNPDAPPPPPPPPRFGPDDVAVRSILFLKGNPERSQVFLLASGSEDSEGVPAGDLVGVGEDFVVPAKQSAKLRVVEVRADEVDFATPEGEFPFTVGIGENEVDAGSIMTEGGLRPDDPRYIAPRETRMVGDGQWEVGDEDIKEWQAMPDDRIYAAVGLQQARDGLNEVRGLRITSIEAGSLFERVGLKKGDIVLSVNGLAATDRAELLRKLRNSEPRNVIEVQVERYGSPRTMSYRVPR